VLASMKPVKYKTVLVFDGKSNNVVRAACKCPAGYVFKSTSLLRSITIFFTLILTLLKIKQWINSIQVLL